MAKDIVEKNYSIGALWKITAPALLLVAFGTAENHDLMKKREGKPLHLNVEQKEKERPINNIGNLEQVRPNVSIDENQSSDSGVERAKETDKTKKQRIVPQRFLSRINAAKIRAYEILPKAEQKGTLEKTRAIAEWAKLSPDAVIALLDRESGVGSFLRKTGAKKSSADGICQITNGTMRFLIKEYGDRCVEIVSKFDYSAGKELEQISKALKNKIAVSSKKISALRDNDTVSIALTCAHLADRHEEIATMFDKRKNEFLDKDHLSLLGLDENNCVDSKDGLAFLLWARHLWGDTYLFRMLKDPANTPMFKIIGSKKASKILRGNGFPVNSTVKDAFQLVAFWYESSRLGHSAYFSGEPLPEVPAGKEGGASLPRQSEKKKEFKKAATNLTHEKHSKARREAKRPIFQPKKWQKSWQSACKPSF